MQADFVRDLAAALKPDGEFRFTTDHADYFETAQTAVVEANVLERAPEWNWSLDPKTDFQQGFEAEGRVTNRARWIKPS